MQLTVILIFAWPEKVNITHQQSLKSSYLNAVNPSSLLATVCTRVDVVIICFQQGTFD